jgi:FSR family fosmidomycin resistance protein-like MFS transporter
VIRQSLIRRRRFILHSFAHLVNDSYSGFLAPLLPLLAAKHGLGLAGAGLFAGLLTLAASLSQPLWGLISDRRPSRWFVPVGILAAGIFLSLMGMASSIALLALVIIVGGLGVACFHPMGTTIASALAARRKGLAIALYITAGSIGYALGPILISSIVARYGLACTYLAIAPALAMAALWIFYGPRDGSGLPSGTMTSLPSASVKEESWKPVILLTATSVVRAFVVVSFLNFLPFHLQRKGLDLEARSIYLFALQFGDAVGSLMGGMLSDRLGRWRIMFWSPLPVPVLLIAFLNIGGSAALIPLFLAGMMLFASAPAVIVSAQKLLPRRPGIAAALQIGFAFGTSGLMMTGVGRMGELFGLERVFHFVAILPLLMVVWVWFLRSHRKAFEAAQTL